jgi:predicted nucleic acid-binding protein
VSIQFGCLDTNIFVHALHRGDSNFDRCRAILTAIEEGQATGWIEITVLHELTYVLGRLPSFPDRAAIHSFIQSILRLDGIQAQDKTALMETLTRWATQRGGFIDAWLAVVAQRRNIPICSVNIRDFPDMENTFLTGEA